MTKGYRWTEAKSESRRNGISASDYNPTEGNIPSAHKPNSA